MYPELPSLYLVATNASRPADAARVVGKTLVSSLMRHAPLGQVMVRRPAGAAGPLHRVEKAGVADWDASALPLCAEGHGPFCGDWHWSALPSEEQEGYLAQYGWVVFLGSGCLVRRGMEHLLETEADVLWAALPSVPLWGEDYQACLTHEEKLPGYSPDLPHSRPWREAASTQVWAVRSCYLLKLLRDWRAASAAITLDTSEQRKLRLGWNRFLRDTGLKVQRFERGEIQFPDQPTAKFLEWQDACVLSVGDWPVPAQSKFLQAWFYGTFFGDTLGTFLDIVEP